MKARDREQLPAGADAEWISIEGVQDMPPFLVSLVSDEDHWLFIASNGGLTAGRRSPDLALFAYTTQDKLIDLAGSTGALTRVRVGEGLWRPLDPTLRLPRSSKLRSLSKRLDGTQLRFDEREPELGLAFTATWGFSRRFGIVRRCELRNLGQQRVELELLDGVQNVQACGLSDAFLAQFGQLADAYRRVERLPGTGLRLVSLSSVPTDRAEPSESLRCNVVWSTGLPDPTALVSTRQLLAFEDGQPVQAEAEARGRRAACLDLSRLALDPGQVHRWYTVGDVDLSTAAVSFLQRQLEQLDPTSLAALLESELQQTSAGLRRKVAAADGLQCSADRRRQSRHLSNVMFNIMRGGIFLDGSRVPRAACLAHLRHFDRPVADRHAAWLQTLPEQLPFHELVAAAAERGDPDLQRLVGELLPLTFGRRHGDPSRPWNRFSIRVRDRHGEPLLAWQGNWRDVFQNWEALLQAFPDFTEAAIARFLNATTADGYNPYRITSEGFQWETVEPDEPWSNIGYWGDHQLIYLLRLLEASQRFHPERLDALLDQEHFAFARVPYRIAPYEQLLADPRHTVSYDHAAEAEIDGRVQGLGADGKLLAGPGGAVLHVGFVEKLLVPLLAKLSNLVPGAGIWMNTQRPEWNDANNALVGFGVSTVTLAYAHRSVAFLLRWWQALDSERPFSLSAEVVQLLRAQAAVFAAGPGDEVHDPHQRRAWMDALGQPASVYRQTLYDSGLSGERQAVGLGELTAFLRSVQAVLAASLEACRRPDALFHGYRLLRFADDGGVMLEDLPVMLEGQVAALSSGLLEPREAVDLLAALRGSALYRPDQDSYMLQPDRDLPGFLEKNRLGADFVAGSELARRLAADPDQDIVESDVDGGLRFMPPLRNGAELRQALADLPPSWQALVQRQGEALVAHFEQIFDHHAFTGRSGSFFAYEGLGSIYWHMVSKLILAVQEQALSAATDPAGAVAAEALAEAFHALQEGLGVHDDPAHYGAFPTDAYSHSPRQAGAQQPGMTGQVKEDILIRWGELGVVVRQGRLCLRPVLLRAEELLSRGRSFAFLDVHGQERVIELSAGSLAFTFCQVPVLYRVGPSARLTACLADGSTELQQGTELSSALSRAVFGRSGQVERLELELPAAWLRH